MLRLLLLLLLLANAGYFAWSHGALAAYGFAPAVQSEPQRMAQQLRPEAMRILTTAEADKLKSVPNATSASSVEQSTVAAQCLQAGVFSDEQSAALRTRLQNALPTGSWAFESSVEPARWMIYMGKYTSADALAKKKGELRQRNISFEPLNSPALEPGLSLGNFSSQLDADTELARIAKRGVKTARVIQAQTELRGQKLKLVAVTPAMRAQLESLKPQLAGKTLQACR